MKEIQLNALDKVAETPGFTEFDVKQFERGFKKFWAKRNMDQNGNDFTIHRRKKNSKYGKQTSNPNPNI
jgi:hypothetical protein